MHDSQSDAVDRLLERHRQYLLLLARMQLGPQLQGKVDLSGVVQMTLLEAHRAQAELLALPAKRQTGWLRQALAHNLADEIRRTRRAKRNPERERSLEAAIENSSLRLERWIQSAEPDPADRLSREEQALHLADALGRLPEAQREAVVLHYCQGWKLAEIAEHLDRTRPAVAGLLKRGLQQLRESPGVRFFQGADDA